MAASGSAPSPGSGIRQPGSTLMRCSLSGQEISTVIGVAFVMTTFSGSLKPELYSTARAHETAGLLPGHSVAR